MKKRILSTVISTILSLFLAILLLGGSLCVYGHRVVCDPEALLQTSISSGYTQELYEQIQYSWENYLAISGVAEPEPIMAVLTTEKVQQDVLAYIEASYTGTAQVSTDALQAQLDEKVREYVAGQLGDAKPNEELEGNIRDLLNACMQSYTQAISIPVVPKILKTIHNIGKYMKPGALFAFGFSLILTVFLFFIQQKRKNTLYFVGIATATNALLLMGATWLANHYSLVKRLPIDESALRTLLVSYLDLLLDKLWFVGVVFLSVTAVLLFVYLLCVIIEKQIHRKKAELSK